MKTCKKGLHQYSKLLRGCPECYKIAHNSWRKNNKEKNKLTNAFWYSKNKEHVASRGAIWREENREHDLTVKRKYYINNKDKYLLWTKLNPTKVRESIKKWEQANRGRKNATTIRRKTIKSCATPPWLSKEQLLEIQEFYILAQELAWLNQDGKTFHVDHIIPLQGENVCGLHVPWNLQLLPAQWNLSKGNVHNLKNKLGFIV